MNGHKSLQKDILNQNFKYFCKKCQKKNKQTGSAAGPKKKQHQQQNYKFDEESN